MNIHEYQARQLLGQYGVALPPGEVCDTPEAAQSIADKLLAEGADLIAVKSQIQAGGRGKGTFKSGFQGGVKLCKTAEEVAEKAQAMLGNVLVTKQTGPEGRLVSKLLIVAAPNIQKELYLAVLLDRATSRPVVMASTEGGMDIEEVAAKTPEKITQGDHRPGRGHDALPGPQGGRGAGAQGRFDRPGGQAAAGRLQDLVGMRRDRCVEINPLCVVRTPRRQRSPARGGCQAVAG